MPSSPSLAPALVLALASVRAAIREADALQLCVLYPVLEELAGLALSALLVHQLDGHSEELSQAQRLLRGSAGTVPDVWITPSVAASRLGHSERWLRRRRWNSPYSAFCIPGDSGRGFRVSQRGLEEHMERERKRAAHE